nr:hypothetical protein [Tanacetum cinerariifolium]
PPDSGAACGDGKGGGKLIMLHTTEDAASTLSLADDSRARSEKASEAIKMDMDHAQEDAVRHRIVQVGTCKAYPRIGQCKQRHDAIRHPRVKADLDALYRRQYLTFSVT